MEGYSLLSDLLFSTESEISKPEIEEGPPLITKPAIFIALHAHPSYHLIERSLGYGTCGWWTVHSKSRKEKNMINGVGRLALNQPSIDVPQDFDLELWAWDPIGQTFQSHTWSSFMEGCQWLRYRTIEDGFQNKYIPQDSIKRLILSNPLISLLPQGWTHNYQGLSQIQNRPLDIVINNDTIVWNKIDKPSTEWINLLLRHNLLQTTNDLENVNTDLRELYKLLSSFHIDDSDQFYVMTLESHKLRTIFSKINSFCLLTVNFPEVPSYGQWDLTIGQKINIDKPIDWKQAWNNFVECWNQLQEASRGKWNHLIEVLQSLMEAAGLDYVPITNRIQISNRLFIRWSSALIDDIRPGLNRLTETITNFIDQSDSIIIWSLSDLRDISNMLHLNIKWNKTLNMTSYTIIVQNDLSYNQSSHHLSGYTVAIPYNLLLTGHEQELKDYLKRVLNDKDQLDILKYLSSSDMTEEEQRIQEALIVK